VLFWLAPNLRIDASEVEVYPIAKAVEQSISISDFNCGREQLDNYIHNEALLDDKTNIGKVFLFITTQQKKVVGFVTLAMSQLGRLEHEQLQTVTTSRTYIPGLLLGHMARHIDYRGRGLGMLMRDWVIERALYLSQFTACRLIILQALDDDVANLYERWGFLRVEDFEERGRRKMFIDLRWRTKG
jgi:hypothetical protein